MRVCGGGLRSSLGKLSRVGGSSTFASSRQVVPRRSWACRLDKCGPAAPRPGMQVARAHGVRDSIGCLLLSWSLVAACGRTELDDRRATGAGPAPQDASSDPRASGDAPAPPSAASCPDLFSGRAAGPRPSCPPGTFPEVTDSCQCLGCHGCCPMHTGACLPCAGECSSDADCVRASRFGCCSGFGSCSWAVPRGALRGDACLYDATSPPPVIPPGCPRDCIPGSPTTSMCKACWHCPPSGAACQGGRCIVVWGGCESGPPGGCE